AAVKSASGRGVVSSETDGVHHHVLFLGSFHDVLQRVVSVAEVHRCVDAIGEHQDDAAALLVQQGGDADVHGAPQRGRTVGLQLGLENPAELVVVRATCERI